MFLKPFMQIIILYTIIIVLTFYAMRVENLTMTLCPFVAHPFITISVAKVSNTIYCIVNFIRIPFGDVHKTIDLLQLTNCSVKLFYNLYE